MKHRFGLAAAFSALLLLPSVSFASTSDTMRHNFERYEREMQRQQAEMRRRSEEQREKMEEEFKRMSGGPGALTQKPSNGKKESDKKKDDKKSDVDFSSEPTMTTPNDDWTQTDPGEPVESSAPPKPEKPKKKKDAQQFSLPNYQLPSLNNSSPTNDMQPSVLGGMSPAPSGSASGARVEQPSGGERKTGRIVVEDAPAETGRIEAQETEQPKEEKSNEKNLPLDKKILLASCVIFVVLAVIWAVTKI